MPWPVLFCPRLEQFYWTSEFDFKSGAYPRYGYTLYTNILSIQPKNQDKENMETLEYSFLFIFCFLSQEYLTIFQNLI
jgi:hypothetical protein